MVEKVVINAVSPASVKSSAGRDVHWADFDQIWGINLKRRADRLCRSRETIDKSDWPFQRYRMFSGAEGNKVAVP